MSFVAPFRKSPDGYIDAGREPNVRGVPKAEVEVPGESGEVFISRLEDFRFSSSSRFFAAGRK